MMRRLRAAFFIAETFAGFAPGSDCRLSGNRGPTGIWQRYEEAT
jgi:hypothetical protein